MGSYVHHIPGRLRVKIPSLKRQPATCQKTVAFITGVDGVVDASSNALTGSLTIYYDADRLEARQLMAMLRRRRLIHQTTDAALATVDYGPATKATQAVGKALVNWALGRALESSGLSLLAALI